jgi:Zn-finger nucleic acid-binding protein
MRLEQRTGVTIDRCDGCQHIWFDSWELEDVLKTERRIREYFAFYLIPFRTAVGEESAMRCPRCEQHKLLQGRVGEVPARCCSLCSGFLVDAFAIEKVPMQVCVWSSLAQGTGIHGLCS